MLPTNQRLLPWEARSWVSGKNEWFNNFLVNILMVLWQFPMNIWNWSEGSKINDPISILKTFSMTEFLNFRMNFRVKVNLNSEITYCVLTGEYKIVWANWKRLAVAVCSWKEHFAGMMWWVRTSLMHGTRLWANSWRN